MQLQQRAVRKWDSRGASSSGCAPGRRRTLVVAASAQKTELQVRIRVSPRALYAGGGSAFIPPVDLTKASSLLLADRAPRLHLAPETCGAPLSSPAQRFPLSYSQATRQAAEAVKAALADGKLLMEIELPPASLESVPGDGEGERGRSGAGAGAHLRSRPSPLA